MVQNWGQSMADTSAGAIVSRMNMNNMNMSGSGACKTSMLWNWNTIDACFISTTWRITSKGMFACCCVGVVCLVVALECLRRMSREYDSYIVRESDRQNSSSPTSPETAPIMAKLAYDQMPVTQSRTALSFRPSLPQQIVRAGLHVLQFGVAYLIMLLAMYFNGYIILSILVGAFIGSLIFSWEQMLVSGSAEVTACCG